MRTTAQISRLRRAPKFPITVKPSGLDVAISRAIARHTAPAPEEIARALTWGADEKLLLVLASVGWLASRGRGEPLRRAGNHALLVTVAASLLPHGLKRLFDQTRPDRRTVIGHVHGIPFSGKREGCLSLGSRPAHGRVGIRGRRVAGRPSAGDPDVRDRALADARSGLGALGKRCRRGICAWGRSGTDPAPVDRISARRLKGGRPCRFLKT